MVYEWKTASYIKVDANVAGKQCEVLEKTGGLTPKGYSMQTETKTHLCTTNLSGEMISPPKGTERIRRGTS